MNIENEEDFKQAIEKLKNLDFTGGVYTGKAIVTVCDETAYKHIKSLEKIKTEENKPIIEALIYLLDKV